MVPAVGRLPRFGLFHGLHELGRSEHPVLALLIVAVVVVAIVMAVRSSRRGR